MLRYTFFAVFFIAVCVSPPPAHATLIGDTIGVTIIIPGITFGTGNTVVTADSADSFIITDSVTGFSVDPSASGVQITLVQSFNGDPIQTRVGASISFFSLDWTDEPGVVVAAQTTNDFGAVFVMEVFDDRVTARLAEPIPGWPLFGSVFIEVFASHGPISVPEPTTLATFVLGLAGLGFMRRRRRVV